MYAACIACALLILAVLALLVGYLLVIGWQSLSWDLLFSLPTGDPAHPGGLLNGIVGTALLVLMASLVAIPSGFLCGVYLSEYAPGAWLAAPVRLVCDVLAGVPSIVVGILGYELLVVPLGNFNGYAGAAALAFIMIPIIARTTEEMLRLVPNAHREASIALGATRSRTIRRVVAPAAAGGLITGIMLAVARVAGETAPLLFTALGSRLLTTDPAHPFPSLTVQIFNYATGPYVQQQRLAWGGMIVLVALIFTLNVVVRLMIHPTKKI
jgi:phosphate transport system permease protein